MTPDAKTVLIVESDPGVREFLEVALRSTLGVEVLSAHDQQDAVRLAESAHPHAVLVETWARPPRGVELARLLKSRPATKDIPVIGLVFSSEGRIAALNAGCDAYVEMPFQLEELLRVVRRYAIEPVAERAA